MKKALILYLLVLVSCSGGKDDILEFHQAAFVADLHDDTPHEVVRGRDLGVRSTRGHIDFPRMREGGLDLIFWSVWLNPDYYENGKAFDKANELIDAMEAVQAKYPNEVRLVKSADEAVEAAEQGLLAGTFGMEGGYPIEEDLGKLEHFYKRGVRYFAPTWNVSTSWATSAEDETEHPDLERKGLTEFGKNVVRKCNELGIMLDVSHLGEASVKDMLEVSEDPIIASHSCVWKLNPVFRNLKDYQIKAIAKGGGVMFVNFYAGFLDSTFDAKMEKVLASHKSELDSLKSKLKEDGREGDWWQERYSLLERDVELIRPPLEALIDHIDYIAKLVGVEHVGLGSDFDGISVLPKGIDDVSDLPAITRALLERGYSREDVEKILGGNLIRVFKQVGG